MSKMSVFSRKVEGVVQHRHSMLGTDLIEGERVGSERGDRGPRRRCAREFTSLGNGREILNLWLRGEAGERGGRERTNAGGKGDEGRPGDATEAIGAFVPELADHSAY